MLLPQELADIIATRQRRERAWHSCIMICKTINSSLESTLAKFRDEIEKEEVEAFKACLRLTIASFAAADNFLTRPKAPTHSRPTKYNCKGSRKDKNMLKEVAIATTQIMKGAASTD
ncbi:putative eka-like protein [Erysiphe necator]|uniref:Putative eka-like protein n=1 Tax=Uncinula necator TaxID=52586 RepID=A0A0B1P9P2_UNCNE|nr:putative eka-like protein [Erysiphe necator]